jgi:hypothetical protein
LIGLDVKSPARLALALALVLASCGSGDAPPTPAPSRDLGSGPTVFALLADHRLVAVAPRAPAVGGEVRLPGTGTSTEVAAHVVAIDPQRRLLRVLGDHDSVTTVDTRTLTVLGTWTLPAGIAYRALAVGSVSGDVFAFGDRAEDGGHSPWLTRLSADGTVKGTGRLRPAAAHDWAIYAAAIAADERYAVVSYHGADTTGADVVRLDGPTPQDCAAPGTNAASAPGPAAPTSTDATGCIAEIHGAVIVSSGRVWGTTGDGAVLVNVDPVSLQPRRLDPALPGNHLMEFAVDPAGPVYAIGSCLYSGGLSRLDLGATQARVLAPPMSLPQRPDLCGERIAVGPAGLLAITRGPETSGSSRPVGILLVDGATGHVRATVPTEVAPIDVAVS